MTTDGTFPKILWLLLSSFFLSGTLQSIISGRELCNTRPMSPQCEILDNETINFLRNELQDIAVLKQEDP